MLIKYLSLVLFLSFSIPSYSQLVRVTTGDIVNDGRYSEGAMWLDYNNDGHIDLMVCNIISQNNLLYTNNGNGTFTTVTTGGIVNDGGFSYGGTFGDYDNDGDVDIFIVNGGGSASENNFYYTNNGNGTFTRVTTGTFVNEVGNSWGSGCVDYDNDGKLDIYTANFNVNNFLYKGNGDGTFTKITTGNIVNDGGHSINPAWCDYDNDGDQDLFVANGTLSGSENDFFYENNGNGTFTKVTTGVLVTSGGNSTGASWGDYDNDGFMDLFVTNYGGQNNFLFRNNGDRTFTQITTGAIVNDGGASVGSSWSDYDNDGDLDLIVSNDNNQNEFFYVNNGDGTFTKQTSGDPVDDGGRTNGTAWGDVDKDGDLDLFMTNGNQSPAQNNFFYLNSGNTNKWLSIRCIGVITNRSAIGARVKVKAVINGTPKWQIREISGQTGYNAQNQLNAHFGLQTASVVDSVVINWPSGETDIYTNVQSNQYLTAIENGGLSSIGSNLNEIPSAFKLNQNYPNPFNPATVISYELPSNSFVSLSVYNIQGKLIETLVSMEQKTGRYEITWNAESCAGGVYYYTLNAGELTETRKMVVIK
jgi:hypothetical protein